ncbi:hypothetical protein WJX82_009428 [Trebouxia sp. C0006]
MVREPFRSKHRESLATQWKGLVAIGIYMAANISLNNLSLVLITLSLNQVIRSSIPVCAAVSAVVIEKKVPSATEATALLVLTAGVMMAVFEGSVTGSTAGILLCICGTVCNAAMICTSGKLLSEKMDVLRLAFYTAPVSCAVLLPLFVARESTQFREYAMENSAGVALVLLCSSAIALLYNVVHAAMIKRTSAVTVTVLGEVKVVGLLILSAILLDEKKILTVKMSIGISLAMLGFGMYSHTKIEKIQQQAELYGGPGPQKLDQIPYTKLDSDKGPSGKSASLNPLPSVDKQPQGMPKGMA